MTGAKPSLLNGMTNPDSASQHSTYLPSPTEAARARYAFTNRLVGLVDSPGKKRKGERTRDRVLLATARLLEATGFRGLRHTDICVEAGIGVATFYLYFEDKLAACRTVLEDFIGFIATVEDPTLGALREIAADERDPYPGILLANITTLRLATANLGLFRCFLESIYETDEFIGLWRQFSHQWYRRSALSMLRRGFGEDEDDIVFRVTLAGGMVDEALRALLVFADDRLVARAGRVAPDEVALAEHLSAAWYRIVIGTNPPEDIERSARRALAAA